MNCIIVDQMFGHFPEGWVDSGHWWEREGGLGVS